MKKSTVIGIDLGTSTTEAAVFRDGRPEILLTMDHKAIIPSVVGLDEGGNWIVGERAKAQMLLAPDRTAMEVKRLIGKGKEITLGKQNYSPVDLSSRILEYVRTYAGEYLGETIERAVISVPAYFDDIQRHETLLAGTRAGLQVERILNEPTAAALSYGLEHMEEESHILVYDLGGGTFDVTLLEMFEGILEVKASSGDNELGGKDFDRKLIDYLVRRFRALHGIDLEESLQAMVRIRDAAEECKMALSTSDSYRIVLPLIARKGDKPLALDETITVGQFEEMTRDLIERTHAPIEVVLQDGGILASEIDRVILVGGSTRMPMVEKDISSFLGITPSRAVNPDLAVAEGAAIQAGMIQGIIDPEEGLVMTDVNPYTLGVQSFDGYTVNNMTVIIPRNVTIPVERTEIFTTHHDYQTEADIRVYQGESALVTSNHFLGEFRISGIPSRHAGKENIKVSFAYDVNGILDVKAVIVSTGKQASIQIDLQDTGSLPLEEEEIDLSGWKDVKGSSAYRAVIRRVERMMKKIGSPMDGEMDILSEGLDALKRAIILEEWDEAKELEENLIDLVSFLEGIDT